MVRAILEGRKTQTRRIVKAPGHHFLYGRSSDFGAAFVDTGFGAPGEQYLKLPYGGGDMSPGECTDRVFCPYGIVGSRLWVRENYTLGSIPAKLQGAPQLRRGPSDGVVGWCLAALYEGDPHPGGWFTAHGRKPSIHMPRWASRITLEITGVRVERVQDISEADARAEGMRPNWAGDLDGWNPDDHGYLPLDADAEGNVPGCDAYETFTARDCFARLWDSINGKRAGCSWESNPWVFAIEFKRDDHVP